MIEESAKNSLALMENSANMQSPSQHTGRRTMNQITELRNI